MASSFNQKSSSSASKAPKPTYRRASAAPKASAGPKRSSRPSAPVSRGKVAAPKAPAKKKISMPGRAQGAVSSVKSPAVRAAAGKASVVKSPAVRAAAGKASAKAAGASQSRRIAAGPKVSMPGVKAPGAKAAKRGVPAFLRPIASALGAVGHMFAKLFAGLHIPKPSRAVVFVGAGAALALALAAVLIVNSSFLAATDIKVNGSDHVEQATAQALVEVPEGTTLLNVNEDAILSGLSASPWVKGVSIEKGWPHTLIITPVERQVKAIAYITADELAWAIGDDGTWIAPVTLVVAVDAEGNEVALNEDGSVPEGATLLSSQEAALRMAQDAGCLLFTDVPSDISPKSGESVSSKVVLAGLEYANGFSPEFTATIKSLSIASVEAISANLESGVEVSLGEPEHIVEKERVITKLIEQEVGVTFINVREPGAYTFRSAPH